MSKDLAEIIKANLNTLTDTERVADAENHLSDIREIICPFNKKGNNPICDFCTQPSEKLNECKDWYVTTVSSRPMEIWAPEFNRIEVRERKKLNKSQFTTLNCESCYLSKTCPEFKEMSTCSIDWSPDTDLTNPKDLIDTLIALQQERIQIARAAELMDGGIPDQNLSNEMDRLTGLINTKNEMLMDKFSIKIEGQQQSNSGGGILSKLFGGMNKPVEQALPPVEEIKTIEITANPTFDEKILEPERRGKKKVRKED